MEGVEGALLDLEAVENGLDRIRADKTPGEAISDQHRGCAFEIDPFGKRHAAIEMRGHDGALRIFLELVGVEPEILCDREGTLGIQLTLRG